MKMLTFVAILLIYGCTSIKKQPERSQASAIAESTGDVSEGFVLFARDCYTTMMDMRSGVMDSGKTGSITLACTKKAPNIFQCVYLDEKRIEFGREIFNVTKTGSTILGSAKGDTFEGSMISRKIFWTTNLYGKDGSSRGIKTCSGDLVYASELDELLKRNQN